MLKKDIKSIAKKVVQIECDTLSKLAMSFDESFVEVVHLIQKFNQRLIICGIGKSAIVAQKIVATLNSTGTPSIFLHAADAIHGDSGIIRADDIVMIISKSGETSEIVALASLVRTYGNTMVAMVSNRTSTLGKYSDYILFVPVEQEADPNMLAPTSSTIAQIAMGDALAITLLELRGFSKEEFAKYHPGGSLGKRLFMTVEDLYQNNGKPQVISSQNIEAVILEISRHRLGATAVVDDQGTLIGIITDGDLRRMIQANKNWTNAKAVDIMTANPKSIAVKSLAVEALGLAQSASINQVPIVNEGTYEGMIHLHDFLREGLL